jgi:hypothetical protein
LNRLALEFILVIKFGWSKLSIWGDQLWNPITTKHRLILSSIFFSHGSIRCIVQLSCLQIWILFTQEYVMAFWMKTINRSTRFCWWLYTTTLTTLVKTWLNTRTNKWLALFSCHFNQCFLNSICEYWLFFFLLQKLMSSRLLL